MCVHQIPSDCYWILNPTEIRSSGHAYIYKPKHKQYVLIVNPPFCAISKLLERRQITIYRDLVPFRITDEMQSAMDELYCRFKEGNTSTSCSSLLVLRDELKQSPMFKVDSYGNGVWILNPDHAGKGNLYCYSIRNNAFYEGSQVINRSDVLREITDTILFQLQHFPNPQSPIQRIQTRNKKYLNLAF